MKGRRLTPEGIVIDAPAKLNLYLHVTGLRDDGYHELESLVAFANVCDSIRARPAQDLTLAVRGPFAERLILDDNNLVLRAARALQNAANIEEGAQLTLTKNLPVASGIGGGSANAAATIRALVRLWDVQPSNLDFSALALSLGADVPVCLYGRVAFMSGIGEKIQPAPQIPPAYLVIVNPGITVSTPAVFKARKGPYSEPVKKTHESDSLPDFTRQLASRCNDLTAPAIAMAPVIGRVLSSLDSAKDCLIARMSGSGATCFGIFEMESQAKKAASRIEMMHPGWWIKTANLLG